MGHWTAVNMEPIGYGRNCVRCLLVSKIDAGEFYFISKYNFIHDIFSCI